MNTADTLENHYDIPEYSLDITDLDEYENTPYYSHPSEYAKGSRLKNKRSKDKRFKKDQHPDW